MSEIVGTFPNKRVWQCPDCGFATEAHDQERARERLLTCTQTKKRTSCTHRDIRPRKPHLKSP